MELNLEKGYIQDAYTRITPDCYGQIHMELLVQKTKIMPETCRVISVICIANDKAIIEGIENSPIPIVKSDIRAYHRVNFTE